MPCNGTRQGHRHGERYLCAQMTEREDLGDSWGSEGRAMGCQWGRARDLNLFAGHREVLGKGASGLRQKLTFRTIQFRASLSHQEFAWRDCQCNADKNYQCIQESSRCYVQKFDADQHVPAAQSSLFICTLIAPVLGFAAVSNALTASSSWNRWVTSLFMSMTPLCTSRIALGQVLQYLY